MQISGIKRATIALLLSLGLTACGGSDEPEGVIPQGQLDAMEKAENVEDVLQQAEEQRRELD